MRNRLLIGLIATGLFATLGCERPFVEVSTPQITITSPELSIALLQPTVQLRVRSSSFRDVTQVFVNGLPLTLTETDEWVIDLVVARGLNDWVIEAIDSEFVSSVDTFYALRADVSFSEFGPRLPTAVGGFAVSQIANGAVLVTGGALQVGAVGTSAIFRLPAPNASWEAFGGTLGSNRVGHTSTVLPNGRVLIIGGGSRDNVSEVSQLVESVDIIDIENVTVRPVTVVGEPIRRMYHTASIRLTPDGTLVDLFGGIGDINYGSNPRLGTRSDFRSFLFRNDSLLARHTAIGPRLGPPVSGHSQSKLRGTASFAPTQFAYFGAFFGPTFTDPIAFEADFADPRGIITSDSPVPKRARSNHADVALTTGMVGLFGGRTDNANAAIASIEVFSSTAGRFFEVPVVSSQPMRRFGHRAVRFGDGSILLIGGFNSDGVATTATEILGLGF